MWPSRYGIFSSLGAASEKKLIQSGIRTIGEAGAQGGKRDPETSGRKAGHHLWRYANGIDDSPVKAQRDEAKGFSVETTVEEDIVTEEQAQPIFSASVTWLPRECGGRQEVYLRGGYLAYAGFKNRSTSAALGTLQM